ncbi:MAG: DUF3806 domain-containing protein [Tetrasphaera sp.]|nr:DUF3806 domain-containing protein [Tetrasphaera sp.]
MAWFGRGKGSADEVAEAAAADTSRFPTADESMIDDAGMGPLRPRDRRIGANEQARIDAGLAALAAAGVSVDDLDALGAAYDREYAEWHGTRKGKRPDHDLIVEKYAIGIGEHLARTTDLRWRIVTDVFGTDLALADQKEGDFIVVPTNLVAARWMRTEIGWIPGVVRHLIAVRTDAR